MTDDYERRYRAALARIEAKGISRWAAEPPWLRLARGLGMRPRPPHYAPFWANVMGHGVVFMFLWGIVMWMLFWGERVPPAAAAVTALLAGILFGLVMAFLYRATAERCGLGRWDELAP